MVDEPAIETNAAIISVVSCTKVPVPHCEEFSRMISSMPFDARRSPVLQAHKVWIQKQLLQFNTPNYNEDLPLHALKDKRMAVAKGFMGELGDNCNFEIPLRIQIGCNTRVGADVYANNGLSIYDNALVTIGSCVHIGPDVSIYTDTHGTDILARRNGLLFALPVVISDYCWIGGGVIILPGVTIGRGCTIGAGSVVSKNIPDLSVAVGSPARVVKKVKDPHGESNMEDEDMMAS